MAYIGATMTLPGIAGFVLTMGMGVDSNVLIFERIKEELAAQRGVRAAINAGFSRVFLTLLDTHVASLIAAAFLFQFGTGPIRGFATTLSIGLLSNLFTSIFVSKTLFELELAPAPDARRSASENLSCRFSKLRTSTSSAGVARPRAVVGHHPGRRSSSSGRGDAARRRVLRRHDRHRAVRQQPPDPSRIRAALERALPGEGQNAVVQRYGDERSGRS